MHFIRPSVVFSLVLALAGCAKADEHSADTASVRTDSDTLKSTTQTTTQTTTPTGTGAQQPRPSGGVATPESADWSVTESGIGNLRAGMTLSEARAAVPAFSVAASRDSTACTYARTNGLPPGVMVMLEGGKIVRVEVRRGTIATSTGARIGDSEDRIKTLYPGHVTVSPHKYTPGGHYLTVAPASSADRIIFETDGKRVVNYRAGQRPQVEYVEGCS
ncbi:MAG TPA: hypothetical protein VF836_08785 [Gemmatimonadaceae bacterium]